MTMIDRRTMLKTLLGGATVAACGVVLTASQADSAPLTVSEPEGAAPVCSVEKTVFVSGRRRPRSRRRTTCHHVHGKKVCKTY